MKRAPTALHAIGGFGVAVAVLSVAATAAVVVLAPEPAPPSMTGNEAIAALRGEETVLEREVAAKAAQEESPRNRVLEAIIASELDRTSEDVRVGLPEGASREQSLPSIRLDGEQIDRMASQPVPVARFFIRREDGSFENLRSDTTDDPIRGLLLAVPYPAFSVSLRQEDGQWLTVAPPRPFLTGWQRNMLIALVVSLLLLAPLAWFFARRLTRPFRALADALDDTSGPIPQEGPRELQEAAGAIAAMRTKLTGEAAQRARILTAIAHDLRTPLTGLRLRVETVAEPQRTRMVDDIDRMQGMIGEVLGFAQDAAVPVERVDVRPFVASIIGDFGDCAEPIRLAPGEDVTVEVPPLAFRRVVENLIRNALDYADGGEIMLERKSDEMVLTVSDRGPGIPELDRQRLMEPFERGDASRNRGTGGTGLGLSIVRDFAARYRGTFTLGENDTGGTQARLSLPATRSRELS